MQQNASPQENSQKRQSQNRSDETAGLNGFSSHQNGTDGSRHSGANGASGGFSENQNRQRANNSSQSGFQMEQPAHSEDESAGIESLIQNFNGGDIKAAKTGGEVLDACFHDKEKSLILILILLLSSDNADTGLLLALMYLLI